MAAEEELPIEQHLDQISGKKSQEKETGNRLLFSAKERIRGETYQRYWQLDLGGRTRRAARIIRMPRQHQSARVRPRPSWPPQSAHLQSVRACRIAPFHKQCAASQSTQQRGVPFRRAARLRGRYNKVFWVAAASGGNVTWRSVLNPVRLTLFPAGFEFVAAGRTVVVSESPL